jgi:hypothetical protein
MSADVSPATREQPVTKAERIAIRVDGATGSGPVEIHIQERRGEVHMSLRAATAETVERIREALPSLSERLQNEGLHAETWRPDEPARREIVSSEAHPQQDTAWQNGGQRHDRQHDSQRNGDEDRQPDRRFADLFEEEGLQR